jgi:outer membrane lipoprotein SlyB
MKKTQIAVMAGLAFSAAIAIAATSPAKASYDAAKKETAIRYAEDRKLCADEKTSSVRMQCLRDAKTEYSKSLKTASENYKQAAAAPAAHKTASSTASSKAASVCSECGKVVATKIAEQKGESTPLGMIAGGVAGAVLGHQVGEGRGKDVATIAGAAGGAYAGHKIEENMKTTKSWVVSVHFEDGADRDYSFATDPGYASGDAVKLSGNSITRR